MEESGQRQDYVVLTGGSGSGRRERKGPRKSHRIHVEPPQGIGILTTKEVSPTSGPVADEGSWKG